MMDESTIEVLRKSGHTEEQIEFHKLKLDDIQNQMDGKHLTAQRARDMAVVCADTMIFSSIESYANQGYFKMESSISYNMAEKLKLLGYTVINTGSYFTISWG